jgi:hypothetical protein
MPKYRVWLLVLMASLLVTWSVAPASAWEAKLVANYTNDYMYITQTGSAGFFGPYDVDLAPTAATSTGSSLNFWGGDFAQAVGMVSGSDVAWNGMWMTLDPDIAINPALRLRGRYYVGSWATPYPNQSAADPYVNTSLGNLAASEYFNYMSPGVQRSFSPGYWNLLWLTARLPWGVVTVGKRPSTWGMGLSWNGEDNRTSESFSITSDYGPLRIGWSTYLSREGDDTYYARFQDKNNKRYWDSTLNATYRSGALDVGAQVNYVFRHRGPERLIGNNAAKVADRFRDRTDFYGGVYFKYNNGRFFSNAEFDWYDRIDRERGRASSYVFDYRAAGEVGIFSGPAKLSVLVSWHSPMDRRFGRTRGIVQGCITDPQNAGTTNFNPRVASASTSNTGVYRPYSYIMVYGYGLGTSINTDTGEGWVQDAFCKAARLDYAVAANLNVFASFFQANRNGNGYGWGYLKPAPMASQTAIGTLNGQVSGQYRGASSGSTVANIAPNIPDNDLGWEVDAGGDWQLLENFTVRATFGYWQPGKWFNFACIDKTNPLWRGDSGAANAGALWGTNPDRTIDPVMAVNIQLMADF